MRKLRWRDRRSILAGKDLLGVGREHLSPVNRIHQLREKIRQAITRPLDPSLERKRTHPIYLLRLGLQIGRKWAQDRCPQQAALLAFQTALSLVPLIAVGFALLQATSMLNAQSALVEFIGQHVLPIQGETLTKHLVAFSQNVSSGALGFFGVVSTMLLSYLLFHTVEGIFNDIWRVSKRRSLVGKLTVFYPLATLSPVLVGLSLYYTARFWRAPGIVGFVAPMVSTFTAFFLANKLLPKTRISIKSAAVGALVSALLFEAAKRGFQVYVDRVAFKSFSGIYGALGLVPLLLIWIYYSWLVTLFGAEVAYTAQNLPLIEQAERDRLQAESQADQMTRYFNGRVATRLMFAVAENFSRGEKALPQDELVARFRVGSDVIEAIFTRLKEHDIAVEIFGDVAGYMPARPLEEIRLGQIIDLFAGADIGDEQDDPIAHLQRRLSEGRHEVLGDITLADLTRNRQTGDNAVFFASGLDDESTKGDA